MIICWKICVDFRYNPIYNILCGVTKLFQRLCIKVSMKNRKIHNIPGKFINFNNLLFFIAFNSRNSFDGLDRQFGVPFSLKINFKNFTPRGAPFYPLHFDVPLRQLDKKSFSFVDGFLCVIAHFVRILLSKTFSYLKTCY